IYRLLRTCLSRILAHQLQVTHLPLSPSYTPGDVSIVIPTIDPDDFFPINLRSLLANSPYEIIIVTIQSQLNHTRSLLASADVSFPSITIYALSFPSKRKQLAHGILHTTGKFTVLVDDDVVWSPSFLRHALAPFEDPRVGGIGTRQYIIPPFPSAPTKSSTEARADWSIYHHLASRRIVRRNRQISASNFLDGGVTCLSGRTAVYRSSILKDPAFLHAFTHDFWMYRYLLDSGDDTFITRWLIKMGWDMKIQVASFADVGTRGVGDSRFLKQVLRWRRNAVRSALICVLDVSSGIWRHPYVAFNMLESIVKPPLLVLLAIRKRKAPGL
ncbi:glycosyltransferase family 2 protein, partial [Aulographum hederae CBS 113979]